MACPQVNESPRKSGGTPLNFCARKKKEWPQEDNSRVDSENAWEEIIQNPAPTTHTLIRSTQVTKVGVHQIIDVNRYHCWTELLRVTAYVL